MQNTLFNSYIHTYIYIYIYICMYNSGNQPPSYIQALMAKFTPSLLAMVLLVASAAAAEFLNPNGSCGHKIKLERLSSCRQYLRDGSRYEGGGWREAFPQCCDELEKINKQCRCEAVKQVVREQQQVGELQGEEMREMLQTAQSLPSLCRISPHYCQHIPQISTFF